MPFSMHMSQQSLSTILTSTLLARTIFILVACLVTGIAAASEGASPSPPVWPETFHALAIQDRNGSLALVDLYYEWGKGRNANVIHRQLGTTLYDIE